MKLMCLHGGLFGTQTQVLVSLFHLNVSILVDELHALLEAVEAALDAAEDDVGDRLGGSREALVALGLDLGHHVADELDDRDDERARGGGADVV